LVSCETLTRSAAIGETSRIRWRYLRAELPGLDPGEDIDITVDAGVLSIRAERREEHKEERRSEFRYGSLSRSVTLPVGADLEHITASYDQGILEVSVPVGAEVKPKGRRIAIEDRG
jgi:HSP20 family protein